MASKDIDIKLKLDAKQADKDLGDIKDQLDDLDEPVEIEVDADTSAAESDLKAVADQTDKLETADTTIDIKADTSKAESNLQQVQTELKQTGEKADETNRKLDDTTGAAGPGNLRGNAIADLTGPLGEASSAASDFAGVFDGLGDAAESVAGKLGLSQGMADKLGGAIAGLGVAVAAGAAIWSIWSAKQKEAEARAKEHREALESLATAIRKGDREAATANFHKMYDEAITSAEKFGLKHEDVIRFLSGETDAIPGLTSKWHELTAARDLANIEANKAQAAGETYVNTAAMEADAFEQLALSLGISREELAGQKVATEEQAKADEHLADVLVGAESAQDDMNKATDKAKTASDHLSESLDKQKQKQQDLTSAEREAVDKKYAYRQATEDAEDAVANMNTVLGDHKAKQEDVEAATDDARDAIIDQSAEYATLKGAALDSKEGIDRQIDSLVLTASTLAPGSPLRLQLEEYIKDLKNIPTNINTTLTTTQQGIIASGGYVPGYKGPQASGGLFWPRPGGTNITVAEAGQPEIVAPWSDFLELIQRASGNGDSGGGNTIIQNFPPGISPTAVAKANKEYHRRGGR
jgi:chromosome segregation ATPase